MATGGNTELLERIGTDEILQKLKKAGDNTEFFYLYVSTASEERKNQR